MKENPYRLADDIWGIGFKTADYPSEVGSLHLTEEGHKVLSERLYEIINQEEI